MDSLKKLLNSKIAETQFFLNLFVTNDFLAYFILPQQQQECTYFFLLLIFLLFPFLKLSSVLSLSVKLNETHFKKILE